jgi:hypothetical protein
MRSISSLEKLSMMKPEASRTALAVAGVGGRSEASAEKETDS